MPDGSDSQMTERDLLLKLRDGQQEILMRVERIEESLKSFGVKMIGSAFEGEAAARHPTPGDGGH